MTIIRTLHSLFAACMVGVLISATTAEAKRHRERARMPTWRDIAQAAVETLLEDIPEKIEKSGQQLGSALSGGAALPGELAYDPALADLSCDDMVNHLILNLDFHAAFYVLVNGWYLGQLGDYASCHTFT